MEHCEARLAFYITATWYQVGGRERRIRKKRLIEAAH